MAFAPRNLPSEPILSGFQALDGTETDLTIDVFGQVEMKGTLDNRLVIEDVLELMSAGPTPGTSRSPSASALCRT